MVHGSPHWSGFCPSTRKLSLSMLVWSCTLSAQCVCFNRPRVNPDHLFFHCMCAVIFYGIGIDASHERQWEMNTNEMYN